MKNKFYKEKKRENILKNTPEYEPYSENEVKLTASEMRELGLISCGGCCGKNEASCNKKKTVHNGCCNKNR